MPATFNTTVPGAIAALQGYFNAIATANPTLNLGVSIGFPITPTNNYMLVGHWQNGDDMVVGYRANWAALPAGARMEEEYIIQCSFRTWSGNFDPVTRIGEAFTLVNGLQQAIINDPGAAGALTPSGSWGEVIVTMPSCGPLGGEGWGVVLSVEVGVINVRF